MPLNQSLVDDAIELHLDIERVALSKRAEIISLLQQLEQELIAKVAKGVTDWSKARIAKQLSEADAIIRQYYDSAAGVMLDTTTDVAQVSASATAQSLSVAVGAQVAISVLPTSTFFETLAGDAIIQGAVQAAWWDRQSLDTAFKFQTAVRQGLVAAETNQQIIRRVLDVTDMTRRNAATLVHTSVQTVANDAREKVFEDNADILSGKEWVAALDRRTCPVCGALDNKQWQVNGQPIGHSKAYAKPPIHWRCRCSMVPITKTFQELGINARELSTTRASMDGQVADTSFENWLQRKESSIPGFADKTLGKGRAELWRSGKITMDQMIEGAKPMSLTALKEKYKGSILENMDSKVFDTAKSGGKYSGFYETHSNLSNNELEKSIKSSLKQIEKHKAWIDNPLSKIENFYSLDPRQQDNLINIHWPADINRHKDQIAIINGIKKERGSL